MHPKLIVAAVAATSGALNLEGAEEFLAGFMKAFVDKDNLPELQKCLKNGDAVTAEVQTIMTEFKKGDL